MTLRPEDTPGIETIQCQPAQTVSPPAEEARLRLHAERLTVARRTRQRSVVRASSVTSLREQQVAEPLTSERVDIVRVPIGRQVATCPPVRVEGDTTILSIVEEIVVIERRLVLKEEVHMTKVRTTSVHRQTVQLREQHAVITREPTD